MTAGALFALTLPGLVLGLVALAFLERLAARPGRRSPLTGRARPRLSAAGWDAFCAGVSPARAAALEQRRVAQLLRDDESDGAPPRSRVDLDRGVAYVVPTAQE